MAGTAIPIVDANLDVAFANKAALNFLQHLQQEIIKYIPPLYRSRSLAHH